jgi:uncharacterized protein
MKYYSSYSFFAFRHNDRHFLFNTAKASVYQVPGIVFEIAGLWQKHPPAVIVEKLSNRFQSHDIEKNIQRIQTLGLFDGSPAPALKKSFHLQELYLQISHACNLKCRYCYAGGGNFGGPSLRMDKDTACKAVDYFLDQLPEKSGGFINFDGGEPLLNWDIVETAVEYAAARARQTDKHIRFKIGTNGTLLSQRSVELMNKYRFSVGISIDGDRSAHDACRRQNDQSGSYHLVEKNFHTFKEALKNCIVQARATITKHNLDVFNVVQHLQNMGFKHIYFEPVSSADPQFSPGPGDYETIKEQCTQLAEYYTAQLLNGSPLFLNNFAMFLKRLHFKLKFPYKCEVGRTGAAITPKGEIYPCYKFANHNDFLLGDVHKKNGQPDIRSRFIENHVDNRPECGDCWARYLCGGGCAYLGYMEKNDIKHRTPAECDFIQHMIKLSLQMYVTVKEKFPKFWGGYLSGGLF